MQYKVVRRQPEAPRKVKYIRAEREPGRLHAALQAQRQQWHDAGPGPVDYEQQLREAGFVERDDGTWVPGWQELDD